MQPLSKREYWLVWKLLDGLIKRGYQFGERDSFRREFEIIRDKCLDEGFDYEHG